jgi:hypothetical protein
MGDVEEFDKFTKDIAIMVLERAALAAKNKEKLTEDQKTIVKRAIGRIVLVTLGTKDDVLLEGIKTAYSKGSTKLPEIQSVTSQGVMAPKSLPMVTASAAGGRRKRGGVGLVTLLWTATALLGGIFDMNEMSKTDTLQGITQVTDYAVVEVTQKCPWPILEGEGKPTMWDTASSWVCNVGPGSQNPVPGSRCATVREKIATYEENKDICSGSRTAARVTISNIAIRAANDYPTNSIQINQLYNSCITKIDNAWKDKPTTGGRQSRRGRTRRASKSRHTRRSKRSA